MTDDVTPGLNAIPSLWDWAVATFAALVVTTVALGTAGVLLWLFT